MSTVFFIDALGSTPQILGPRWCLPVKDNQDKYGFNQNLIW